MFEDINRTTSSNRCWNSIPVFDTFERYAVMRNIKSFMWNMECIDRFQPFCEKIVQTGTYRVVYFP